MHDLSPSQTCKNCNNLFSGAWCNQCGQRVTGRLTASFIWRTLHEEIFEVDHGLLFTFREFWIRPGKMVLDYIGGATVKYYNPLKYLVFWTALCVILVALLPGWTDFSFKAAVRDAPAAFSDKSFFYFFNTVPGIMGTYLNFYLLGLIPLLVIFSYFIQPGRKFNVTELSILYLFYYGQFSFSLIIVLVGSAVLGGYSVLAQLFTVVFALPVFLLFFKMLKQFFGTEWHRPVWKSIFILYGALLAYDFFLFMLFNLTLVVVRV